MYSLLIKNGTVIDPVSGIKRKMDVAVEDRTVAALEEEISPSKAKTTVDVEGSYVTPGFIDSHVHLTRRLGGHEGFYMLAKAGITTAVDFAGPAAEIRDCLPREGCGLNVATLEAIIPGDNLSSENPDIYELEKVISEALSQGALGIKIMGGHYPLTPEATARAIETANRLKAYVAFHAGTTTAGSNLEGALQALDLVGTGSMHLAHINSYCRGYIKDPLEEVLELLTKLEEKDNVVSGSYLAMVNGTSGKCSGGVPESLVTRKSLEKGCYPPTEEGLERAIMEGFAGISLKKGMENVLMYGENARDIWKGSGNIPVSFPVNSPQAIFLCATRRKKDGSFLVPAIVSDGGAIARNCIVERGLTLVSMQYMSISDLVTKASVNPAKLFGFTSKGSLAPGMDADISILDPVKCRAKASVAGGKFVMMEGYVTGYGGTFVTSTSAEKEVLPLETTKTEMAKSALYS
jgi:cytosine/adenosine deaminase-related metal-dependent hydrolase